MAAVNIADTLLAGMEAYIPFSIKTISPTKPWFDLECSRAIQARERAYQAFIHSRSDLTFQAYKAAKNHCTSVIRKAKKSFILRKNNA